MTDAEIIKSLKSEPIEDLRRLQKKPFAWKVDHAKDVIREFYETIMKKHGLEDMFKRLEEARAK